MGNVIYIATHEDGYGTAKPGQVVVEKSPFYVDIFRNGNIVHVPCGDLPALIEALKRANSEHQMRTNGQD